MTRNRFEELISIMAKLRSPEGCPWDREQTHKSLQRHLLEETYEVLEAIDSQEPRRLAGELGDLLLQVVFHAQIAAEEGTFTIDDVVQSINDKLIRRHPHVFGDAVIRTAAEQTVAWEKSKMTKEGKRSALDGVPKELPALLRAHRLQQKASAVGFDWSEAEPVWEKVSEETAELKEAAAKGDADHVEEEFGDLLFSLVNLGRFLKVEPEEALRRTCEKFERRFRRVEEEFVRRGVPLSQASLEEMDAVWEKVKGEE